MEIPKGNFAGFRANLRSDLLSGFLVFLIALPLCLGISLACGYPAISGIFTAIIGGLLATFFSNSELTIKGPAAGLIVIALGCVTEFGFTGGKDPAADYQAYRLALGVGVAAGILQILLGVFRSGILGEFFPTTAIHGLLAAIGVIIIAKQFPIMLGLHPDGKPLELLANIPTFVLSMNPKIGLIGILSLLIMFGYAVIRNPRLKVIPAPMIVLIVAVPLGLFLEIGKEGTYTFLDHTYSLGEKFFVDVPLNMFTAITFPDFSGLTTVIGIKYVMMFAIIGSLESLLSAKAIDGIDPWGRKTDMDRDLLAVGLGNTVAAFIGGLPMISEIVRSKANIDNGAQTRFANFFHGLFLLVFVALIPGLINQIPLAALGALLVFTGFRLASPKEFVHMYYLGKDQFIIFMSTVIGVLATDLLVGIGIGIGVKVIIHLYNGTPIHSFFKLNAEVTREDEHSATIVIRGAAVFSTWIPLRKYLHRYLQEGKNVTLNFSDTRLVDHTVMSKLYEWIMEFEEKNCELFVRGLAEHEAMADSIVAAHVKRKTRE
ncbi:SulP family inorganic anion transporter [Candidatus Nitronereus thalassa]|uniref:SulP family inorganic anion transporter n=1 Tax=Candidatus Nitronereus thalassa TaxID=3020898 RepID=A0ABU3KAI4_9BACT|nr:SulP family inorganic anion transporter [Candidatus Nitronereus thalassa]MDT7043367.1 SulP family inorganic anion transporter [Candidatus Nitronereus thalassa]